jgi:hypothetical protein
MLHPEEYFLKDQGLHWSNRSALWDSSVKMVSWIAAETDSNSHQIQNSYAILPCQLQCKGKFPVLYIDINMADGLNICLQQESMKHRHVSW